MRSWGDSRICQAAVIRDILRGRLAPHPDPHGLRLRAARITGRLDLENLSTQVKFELQDCLLEEGFVARDAHLATVILTGCQLEHPTEPPLDAARLTCTVLSLRNTTIIGHTKVAAVMLGGAHIGGSLDCEGSELRNDTGPALVADGLQVSQSIFLRRGFTATGVGENGAVRLPSAHIDVQLDCDGAKLRNDSGPALIADSLEVSQDMHLRGAFTATGADEHGAVRLRGAHIGGQLDFDGAKLRNDSGPALIADSLEVSQDMHLHGGFIATAVGRTVRSTCAGPTSAASSISTGRNCVTTPPLPWTPRACRSTRTCTCTAGSPPRRRERCSPPSRGPHRRPPRLRRAEAPQ